MPFGDGAMIFALCDLVAAPDELVADVIMFCPRSHSVRTKKISFCI
jgi:hypothetical protein